MSAISGVLVRRGTSPPGPQVFPLLAALTAYGRHGSGHWIDGPVAFGHQLTIEGPEDHFEALPWRDATAGLTITADVRLDNREELCASLGVPGPHRTELPSSRLLLRAWEKWGTDSPRHLVGDFAFAIWDARRRTLFCARDHVGARAFYYSLTPDRMVFASDIKGVLAAPGVSERLDEEYVTAALADKRFYRKDRTYFEAIRKLAPGHSLTVTLEGERLERYWFPEAARNVRFAHDEDYVQAAREIYGAAVRDRLRTDQPVGVHLSGGLDSSSVTALAARERRRQGLTPPVVLSGQPAPDPASPRTPEHLRIEAVCAQEGLAPIYCPPDPDDILTVLSKDPACEPIHSTSTIETTIQRTAATEGVRLILAGWGGDESLSYDGRGYYAELLLRGRWGQLFREGGHFGAPWKFMAREAFLLLFPDRNEALKKLTARSLHTQPVTASFIHPDLHGTIKLHKIPCRQASIRSTLVWLWTRGCLGERMESWTAHGVSRGIRYAYPMLDRRLLEFVVGLPPDQFVRGRWKRWLMRKTMGGILPDEICWQPDKTEPLRFERGMSAYHRAFCIARERLSTAEKSPSRARYVDMPRLLDRMRPERLMQNPRPGDIFRALAFLDF